MEGPACADTGARTPIGASGINSIDCRNLAQQDCDADTALVKPAGTREECEQNEFMLRVGTATNPEMVVGVATTSGVANSMRDGQHNLTQRVGGCRQPMGFGTDLKQPIGLATKSRAKPSECDEISNIQKGIYGQSVKNQSCEDEPGMCKGVGTATVNKLATGMWQQP